MNMTAIIIALLDRQGVAYRVEHARSRGEANGPSAGVYIHTAAGTIRLSDHAYLVPESGVDLRYGMPAADIEAHLSRLLAFAPSPEAASVLAGWTTEAERHAATRAVAAALLAAAHANDALLAASGFAGLAGKARKRALARLRAA